MKRAHPVLISVDALRAHDPYDEFATIILNKLEAAGHHEPEYCFSTIIKHCDLDLALWSMGALPPEYEEAVNALRCDIAERVMPPAVCEFWRACIKEARAMVKGYGYDTLKNTEGTLDYYMHYARLAILSCHLIPARKHIGLSANYAQCAAANDPSRKMPPEMRRQRAQKAQAIWIREHFG